MLQEHLDAVFKQYKINYEKIFGVLYPAKNSTGFTERNLSVNFCKAYETLYPQSITWFEFQFGERNNLHYDALVVNPESKTVLLIESKRFSSPNKKLKEIYSDMSRICDSVHAFRSDFDRIENFDEYAVVGVLLTDIWAENKPKVEILESFRTQTFLSKYNMPIVSHPAYYVADFDATDTFPAIKDMYHLASVVWNINR